MQEGENYRFGYACNLEGKGENGLRRMFLLHLTSVHSCSVKSPRQVIRALQEDSYGSSSVPSISTDSSARFDKQTNTVRRPAGTQVVSNRCVHFFSLFDGAFLIPTDFRMFWRRWFVEVTGIVGEICEVTITFRVDADYLCFPSPEHTTFHKSFLESTEIHPSFISILLIAETAKE